MLLTPSLRALTGELHKMLFKPTRCVVQEKKPFKVFHQLSAESRAWIVTLLVTLGRMNLAQYNKAVGTFLKGMH